MSSHKDFVETYNNISSSIEGLIGNNDLEEWTNRAHTVGYIMEQLAKAGLLKESINQLDFRNIDWYIDHRTGKVMKDFDGRKASWIREEN